MAATTQSEQRKQQLVEQLQDSRHSLLNGKILLDEQLANKKEALFYTLNFPRRIQQAVSQQPKKYFGAALLTGLGISFFSRRRTKTQVELGPRAKRSLISTLALALIKPAIKRLILNKARAYAADRFAR